MDKNRNLALYGIIGAVLYAAADLFLYVAFKLNQAICFHIVMLKNGGSWLLCGLVFLQVLDFCAAL